MASIGERLDAALEAYEEAVEVNGEKSLEVVRACWDLGYLHCEAGDIQKARMFLEQAVDILDFVKGPGWERSPSCKLCPGMRMLQTLAFVHGTLGCDQKEREVLHRCVFSQKKFDVKEAMTACLLLSFGTQRQDRSHLPFLERLYEARKTPLTNGNGSDHSNGTDGGNGNGSAFQDRIHASASTILRLHTLLVSLCGMIMAGTSTSRLSLESAAMRGTEEDCVARFFWAVMASNGFNKVVGRRVLRLDYALQALEVLESVRDVLADTTLSDLQKVEKLVTAAAERHGAESLQVAQWLALLAGLCRASGDFESVRNALLKVLRIQQNEFGFDSLYLTWTLRGLAHAEGKLDDLSRKWELLRRAMEIEEAELGSDHAQTRVTCYFLDAVEKERRQLRDPDGTLELARLFPRHRLPASRASCDASDATASQDVDDLHGSQIVDEPWRPFIVAAYGGGACEMTATGSIPIPFYCHPG